MLFKCLLIIALVPALAMAYTPFKKCSGGHPEPREVRLGDCKTARCTVIQGNDVTGEVDFNVQGETTKLTPSIYAIVFGARVEFKLPAHMNDACLSLSKGKCPLQASDNPTVQFAIPLGHDYPTIAVTVEVALKDQSNKIVSCALVDLQIKKA